MNVTTLWKVTASCSLASSDGCVFDGQAQVVTVAKSSCSSVIVRLIYAAREVIDRLSFNTVIGAWGVGHGHTADQTSSSIALAVVVK